MLLAGSTGATNLPVTPGVIQPQPDPAPPGTLQKPLNFDDGFVGLLDLSTFTDGNFFAAPLQFDQGVTWRIGEPLQPLIIPVALSGDPGPLSVTASSRLTASYSASPTPAITVNADPSQTTPGKFNESITIQAANPNSTLTIPVPLSILPRVNFELATTQVDIHVRQGQARSSATTANVAITTDLGGAFFDFQAVSSDRTWLFASVNGIDATHDNLSISVGDLPPGTYTGSITVSLTGVSNLSRTVQVRYIVDPPATIQLSTTTLTLHVVKGQPVPTATATVTGSVPGVGWRVFVGVSRTWLRVTETSRTTPGEIHVTVDPATVEPGYWAFSMFVIGEANQQIEATILVDVSSGAPLDLLPAAIDLGYTRNGQSRPTAQISFTAPSPVTVEWSADQPWVVPRQGSGTTPFTTVIAFDATLPEGAYHGTLTARAGATAQSIPLTWRLFDAPRLVFPTDPIRFRYRIGDPPPPTQQIQITRPTLMADFFEAGPTDTPSFLTVDPRLGPTPATITLGIDAQGRGPGTYQTRLIIQGTYPDTTIYPPIPVTLELLPDPNAPSAALAQLTNAASYLPGAVSPGEILTVFGSGLGPAALLQAQPGATGRFPTTLAGGAFFFDEFAAPIIYVSANQAAVVVPWGVAGRARISVAFETGGKRTPPLALTVADSSPGVFTANASGSGLAAAQNVAPDGSVSPHTLADPATRGGIVTLYVTGLGSTTPALPDGGLAGTPLAQLTEKIQVLVGGVAAQVLYAGPAPGLIAGLMQINIRVAGAVPAGQLPLLILAGDNPSQPGVTLAVK